jgi:hypothetical protein
MKQLRTACRTDDNAPADVQQRRRSMKDFLWPVRWSVVVAGLLAAGCGSVAERKSATTAAIIERQRAALHDAPASSSTEVPFARIELAGSDLLIEPGTAVAFASGKSYAVGLELPPAVRPYRLLVLSKTVPLTRQDGLSLVFKPSVQALDSEGRETALWLNPEFCFSRGWTEATTGFFTVLPIDPTVHRKLVVFTTEAALEGTSQFRTLAITGLAVKFTKEIWHTVPHAPTGKLQLSRIEPETEAKMRASCAKDFRTGPTQKGVAHAD